MAKLIKSNEAYFCFNGGDNKTKCKVFSQNNSFKILELPVLGEKPPEH